MKRCPKCYEYNEDEVIKCKECQYEFKGKIKENSTDKKEDESDGWPSNEWKDWNTM